jgi:glycosyltransferase involved in cell wall biosynthesis
MSERRPLRIRMLIASDRRSGAAGPVADLARMLQEQGHEVRLTCKPVLDWTSQPLTAYAHALGLDYDAELLFNPNWNPFDFRRDVRRLAEELRRERTDLVHCTYTTDHWIGAVAAACAGTGVRVVRSRHHSKPERLDPLHRLLYRRWTRAVTEISQRTAERNRRRLGLPEEKVSVVYGSVDSTVVHPGIAPTDLRQELGLPAEALLIGYPARLVPKRQPARLVEAWPLVVRELPAAHLLLVGRGPLEARLRHRAERLGVGGHVHILGYREDYLNVVRALDMVVFLREGTDGGCRALLEALALARPVLVTEHGPLPELVAATGRLVPDRSKVALARGIIELATDQSARQQLGESARRRAAECFTPGRKLEQILQVYDTLDRLGD